MWWLLHCSLFPSQLFCSVADDSPRIFCRWWVLTLAESLFLSAISIKNNAEKNPNVKTKCCYLWSWGTQCQLSPSRLARRNQREDTGIQCPESSWDSSRVSQKLLQISSKSGKFTKLVESHWGVLAQRRKQSMVFTDNGSPLWTCVPFSPVLKIKSHRSVVISLPSSAQLPDWYRHHKAFFMPRNTPAQAVCSKTPGMCGILRCFHIDLLPGPPLNYPFLPTLPSNLLLLKLTLPKHPLQHPHALCSVFQSRAHLCIDKHNSHSLSYHTWTRLPWPLWTPDQLWA